MKNFKISVHIPYYISDNYVDKSKLLKRVCNSYLKLSKKVKIFIHTNKKLKANNKKIKFIFHDLSKIHSYKLTWVCRKLMLRQKNLFDIFIYGEDDLLFTKNNFNYWLIIRIKKFRKQTWHWIGTTHKCSSCCSTYYTFNTFV